MLVALYWNLWGQAFCYLYVGTVLFLPIRFNTTLAMLLAFVVGLLVDVFYNTLGMHAAALTFMAFLRPRLLNALTPQGGYDNVAYPHYAALGLRWLAFFSLPLLFVHHFIFLAVEYASFRYLGEALYKALLSAFFSFFAMLLVQMLVAKSVRER